MEDLLEAMLRPENLTEAWKNVRRNNGAPGIDGVRVEDYPVHVRAKWPDIVCQLREGTYRPAPVKRVVIPKPDGGERQLGIPTVQDRHIQQALLQILTPLFEARFSDASYGFRPGRSAHQAVEAARNHIAAGYEWVADIDLEKYFDRVNHDILMSRVRRVVKDLRIVRLVRSYLNAGVMENGVCVRSDEGTPQGGPLSPLLANILLDDLDKALEQRGHRFVRYADDCNIYVKSPRSGERVMAGVRDYLEKKLKLKVNEKKSAVARPKDRKFLGFSFMKRKGQILVRIAPRSIERFKENVRRYTRRNWSIDLDRRLHVLNRYLRGWLGYYRKIDTPSILQELDEWIRRRLRTCVLKQWKTPKNIWRNLVAQGVTRKEAAKLAGSRKGWWRRSRTPQMNKALGLAWWAERGLMSLSTVYQASR